MDVRKKVPLTAVVLVRQEFVKQGLASPFRGESTKFKKYRKEGKEAFQRPKCLE
jgi:hypothetical protein